MEKPSTDSDTGESLHLENMLVPSSHLIMSISPSAAVSMVTSIKQSVQRSLAIKELNKEKGNTMFAKTGVRNPCFTLVCPNNQDHTCQCPDDNSHDCLYNTLSPPPNVINYTSYMPTHQEALDKLEELGELTGQKEEYKLMNRSYNKARNQTERWATEVKGVDLNMVQAAIEKAINDHIQYLIRVGYTDLGGMCGDIKVMASNACIEIEKAMGIFPNIKI